jgi:short-subunit dehydrogenase
LGEWAAVVTGATRGIGRAVARELQRLGMRLVLTGRSEGLLSGICAELGAAGPVADIKGPHVPEQLRRMALERHGRCDVVINNAGAIEVGPIDSIDIEKACAMVRVNVEAAYRVSDTFVRHFAKAGFGHLIDVSSVMGPRCARRTCAHPPAHDPARSASRLT